MYGFKAGAKPGKATGGKIRGPGTGTSDSIKAEVPEGSYIMPEDSTRQIGEGTLSRLGKPVPVNVSNGEYHMPPEQVHAVGAKVLDQMKDATHTPVAAQGFKPQEGELYFANGGRVKGVAQTQAPGLGFRIGAGAANYMAEGFRGNPESPRLGFADGGLVDERRRNVPVPQPTHGPQPAPDAKTGGPSAQALANEVPASQLGQPEPNPNAGSFWKKVSNALTYNSDRAAMEQRQAARDVETLRASNRFGLMPKSPSLDVVVNLGRNQSTLQDFERTNGAGSGGAEIGSIAPTATNTSVPGVTRYDRPGESPLFSNVPSGGGIPGGDAERSSPLGLTRVNTVNMREGNETMARANAIRAETAALRQRMADGSAFARGDVAFRKLSPEEQQSRAASQAAADMQSANYNMNRLQEEASRARFFGNTGSARAAEKQMDALHRERGDIRRQIESQARLGLDEQALAQDTARLGFDARRLGLDERRFETEDRIRGFEARGLERMENLYQQLDKAETPEARESIAEQIRAISGREAPNRYTVVPGGQEWDAAANAMRTVPSRVFNNQTGQFVEQSGSGQKAPPGMTAVGKTPTGQIVYQDHQGRRFTAG